MPHPRISGEAITQQGKALYQSQIRTQVEIPENIGKFASINIETGEYVVANDLLLAVRQLQEKQPDAAIWTERIGFNAVYAVGGTLVRTV
jgi:uncharacterized protein (UPF0128 family)